MVIFYIPWYTGTAISFEGHVNNSFPAPVKCTAYHNRWVDIENRWKSHGSGANTGDYWRSLTSAGELWFLANMPEEAVLVDTWPFDEE